MIDSGFHDALGQARKLLAESPFEPLHHVRVEGRGDAICLKGQVASYYLKQLAQETVRTATRGVTLVNSLSVPAPSTLDA